MAQRCDFCGKEPTFGKAISRLSKRATVRRVKSRKPRRFDPNIQTVHTVIAGTPQRKRVCTSCLKKGRVPVRTAR